LFSVVSLPFPFSICQIFLQHFSLLPCLCHVLLLITCTFITSTNGRQSELNYDVDHKFVAMGSKCSIKINDTHYYHVCTMFLKPRVCIMINFLRDLCMIITVVMFQHVKYLTNSNLASQKALAERTLKLRTLGYS
jgi:hypothetical protein